MDLFPVAHMPWKILINVMEDDMKTTHLSPPISRQI